MKKISIIVIVMTLLIFVNSPSFSIINGIIETGYPFTGCIMDNSASGGFFTGNLIDQSWILTVAHDLYGRNPEDFIFLVGPDFDTPDAAYGIDKIFIHPSYDNSTYDNDIALLHLASPITNIVPGLISDSDAALSSGSSIIQVGYGVYDIYNNFDGRKRSCNNIIDEIYFNYLTTNNTCGPWSGDSGGPCLWYNSGKTYIVGIITQGGGTYFSINARVSNYHVFISEAISSYVNKPPSKPVLVSPENGGTNIASPAAFMWHPCTDPDGDSITYRLYLSENSDLSNPVIHEISGIILNLQNKKAFSFMFMILLFIPVCFKRNKRILINLIKILLFCLFISCVNYMEEKKDDEKNHITQEINDLKPGTVYYWRVIAKDEHNAVSGSDVWSFTTK